MILNFKNDRIKRVVNNIISLVVLNIVNYIFPIIIIPILITRLGVNIYGKYIFAFTVLNYLNLIVQYGFNFSATSKIAKNQDNKILISETYSAITTLRFFFASGISLSVFIFHFFFKDIDLYILGIGVFLGQGLIPIWLFQGLEKMKFITLVNSIIRVLAFVLILLTVLTEKDVNNLMLIQSGSFLAGAFLSILIVRYKFKITFLVPKRQLLFNNLKEGWSLFLSTIGINLYRESNVVILGILCGYSIVGLYSPAEKLIKGIQSFTNIIVTALYPYFSKKMGDDLHGGFITFLKMGRALSILFGISAVTLLILSGFIINVYLGKGYDSTLIDFRILSFVIFFGGLNYYYGIIGLVNLKKERLFNQYVWISGVIGMISSAVLSFAFKDIGAAIAMVLAEFVLLILIYNKIRKKNIWMIDYTL